MLRENLVKVGDKAILNLKDTEGYNPAPDGTEVTVMGFSDIYYGYANQFGLQPGVYENRVWIRVRDESGKEWTELYSRLDPKDIRSLETRVPISNLDSKNKIRDLPDTNFVDGDKITSLFFDAGRFPGRIAFVVGVEYHNIGQRRSDDSPMPLYHISSKPEGGWYMSMREEDSYRLVERGRPWKFWHNQKIEFVNLEDEGLFMHRMGQCEYVRNPKYNLYKWDKEEAVEAIYTDLGDVIAVANGLFGAGPHTDVLRYKDRNLGERMRQLTMQGFPRETKTA